ncbi:MAG: FecR domain-containing protein [Pseudomonadales bacterium]|nr:FecR domain-containing protein [Pseudomonadales bacterium]PCJ62272.1 MAG: hypothetical protein COA79_04210 [Planctomycetota bacterium]
MNNQTEYFNLLLEKYIANDLSDNESLKLKKLLSNNMNYQKKFAEALTFEATIQNVMNDKNAALKEAEQNGKIIPFKSKTKHRSRRFQNQKQESKTNKILIAIAAIFAICITGWIYKDTLTQYNNIAMDVKIDAIGQVQFTRNNKNTNLYSLSQLKPGDILETKQSEYIKIMTKDGSSILVNENTKIVVGETRLNVLKGDIYANIQKGEINYFKNYSTDQQHSFSIQGTIFEISNDTQNNTSRLSVEEGQVLFARNKQHKIISSRYSIISNSLNGFGEKRKLLKNEIIAPWISYYSYLKNSDVIFIDNFDSKSIRKDWTITKTGQCEITYPKFKSVAELKVKGLSKIIISSPIIKLDDQPMHIRFSEDQIYGEGPFEYGFAIYMNGELQLEQSIRVKRKSNNKFHFIEVIIVNGEKQKGKGSLVSAQLPIIETSFHISPRPKDDTVDKKVTIDYKQSISMPEITSIIKGENIQIKYFLKGLSKDAKANFGLDAFIVTKSKKLTNKIIAEFIPYIKIE